MADSPAPVALVTGATSGIGIAVARRLREDGHDVAGLDIAPPENLQPDGHGTSDGLFSTFHVGDLTDVPRTTAALDHMLGDRAPAVLVHCAGWTPYGKFLDSTPETDARIVDVNITGMLTVVRPVLSRMVDAGSGRVVLISSDAARVHGRADRLREIGRT